jgi:hypothetical protein
MALETLMSAELAPSSLRFASPLCISSASKAGVPSGGTQVLVRCAIGPGGAVDLIKMLIDMENTPRPLTGEMMIEGSNGLLDHSMIPVAIR